MAEDIRDMSIMGMVYEFRNQAKADAYILRNGLELTDREEMFSVGGYIRVFSLEHNEPAIGIRILSEDEVAKADRSMLFYLDEESGRWIHVDDEIPTEHRIAVAIDKEFLEAVDSHWLGDHYKVESFSFGHTIVFRNGIDGPKLQQITEGDVTVRRLRKDGSIRYYWPKGSRMFQA